MNGSKASVLTMPAESLMPRGNAGRLVGDATAYFFPVAEAANFAQTRLEVRSESHEQSEDV